jgi:hypothetical protein
MKIKGIEYSFKEIFDAWLAAKNPSAQQKELAEKRYDICLTCEHRLPLIKTNRWSEICSMCGCPLNKKIFSSNFNSCPLKKWDVSDRGILPETFDKAKNTLI